MSGINVNTIQNSAAVSGSNSYAAGISSADKLSSVNKLDTKYKLYHLMGPEQDYSKQSGVNAPQTVNNTALDNIKSVSETLKKAADSITSRFPPLFDQLVAAVENSEVIEVTGVNSFSAKDETTEVKVTQTAQSQENQGNALNSNNLDFNEGSNKFTVKVNGNVSNINVNVTETDTNQSVIKKAANSINRRDIGVTARVTENKNDNTSAIVLTSRNTGQENAFTVEDAPDGDFAKKLGANNTVIKARDAVYSVNGEEPKSSASNDVYLGNGINATLNASSDESVKINLSKDTEKIKEQVSEFLNSVNDFLKTAKDDLNSEKIVNQLKSAYNVSSESLEESGIFYNNGNGFNANDKMLDDSIKNDKLKTALGASNDSANGFADRVGRIARNAEADPIRYAENQSAVSGNTFNESSVSGMGVLYSNII